MPPKLCFFGCVFYFTGFEEKTTPDGSVFTLEQLKHFEINLSRRGGSLISEYDASKVTHVIVDTQAHSIISRARADGKRIVNIYWLEDVLLSGNFHLPDKALHFPRSSLISYLSQEKLDQLPNGSNFVSFRNEKIAVSGFSQEQISILKEMILQIGAQFTLALSGHNTLLISNTTKSEKYSKALEWMIPVVSVHWLLDVFLGLNDAHKKPFGSHHFRHKQIDSKDPFELDRASMRHLLAGWKVPIKLERELLASKMASISAKPQSSEPTTVEKPSLPAPSPSPSAPVSTCGVTPTIISPSVTAPTVSASGPNAASVQNTTVTTTTNTTTTIATATVTANATSTNSTSTANQPQASTASITATPSESSVPPPVTKSPETVPAVDPFVPPSVLRPTGSNTSYESNYRVLVTGFTVEKFKELEEIVKKLNGKFTSNPNEVTHLVIDKPRTTLKFLFALNYTQFIVHYDWLYASNRAGKFVPEINYTYDAVGKLLEKRNSNKRKDPKTGQVTGKLFAPFIFFITPSVSPPIATLRKLIQSTASGQIMTDILPEKAQLDKLHSQNFKLVIIAAENDLYMVQNYASLNIRKYSIPFALTFSN